MNEDTLCILQNALSFDGSALSLSRILLIDSSKIEAAAKCVYTIYVDGKCDDREYRLNDLHSILIESPILNMDRKPVQIQIFAKPQDGSSESMLIKSISWKRAFARYRIETEGPLHIDGALRIQPIDSLCGGSSVDIHCPSDIVIGSNAVIDKEDTATLPGAITLQSAGHIVNDGVLWCNEAGGGVIALISCGGVINNGSIECRASSSNDVGGGTIAIVTDGRFENNGIIDCGPNGVVLIECTEFVNEAMITPNPLVLIKKDKTVMPWIQSMRSKNRAKPMELAVKDHRGHCRQPTLWEWDNHGVLFHPRNLLKEGSGDFYKSDYDDGPANEDWIVFEQIERSRFIPTAVLIRNGGGWKSAIKRVGILGSCGSEQFVEWIQIDGIQLNGDFNSHNKDRQIFPIQSTARNMALSRQFTFFKLRVLENFGHRSNIFDEFAMFGVRLPCLDK